MSIKPISEIIKLDKMNPSTTTTEVMKRASEVLKQYFGYETFRPLQAEIIETILNKQDCLVLMPTGGGKSLCFQIPAMIQEGVCIVISPLIALMKDQVEGLQANGVKAAFLNSSLSGAEQVTIENQASSGELDILYVSPEKMLSQNFIMMMERLPINLFAIDEAHCISSWGHDFRPEYTQMSFLKKQYPNIPIVALTATADKLTRSDIINQLRLKNSKLFLASFDRPNLNLTVLPGRDRIKVILKYIKNRPNQSGIIYCLSRRLTEQIAEKLQKAGIDADFYHAGMSSLERSTTQENFIKDKTQIICATVAFGMGIDKSNIRWVIHYNLPRNIEGYYQEIGRAGRDGLDSETILFYSYADIKIYKERLFADLPRDIKELKLQKLDRMLQYADAFNCRRKILLNYFSETLEENCGNCDVCENPPEEFDGTVIAQKALSCVARMRQKAPMGLIIDVLRGSGKKEIYANGFHEIKTYGAGRDIPFFDWQAYMNQLLNLGLFEIAYDEKSALKLTDKSKTVLFDGAKVPLVKLATIKERMEERLKKSKPKTKTEEINEDLFALLKELRAKISKKANIAAYLVFSDATLKEMSGFRPTSEDAMREISGVGEYKLEKYGGQFIEAIRKFLASQTKTGKVVKGGTALLTYEYFRQGMPVEQIAHKRELNLGTIYTHFATLYENGYDIDVSKFVNSKELDLIRKAIKAVGHTTSLRAIFEKLDERIPYHKIRLAIAHFKVKG